MKKFLVFYIAPATVLEDWAKTDPETRKQAEENMRAAWQQWMSEHAAMVTQTEAAGKTKTVSSNGIADFNNDIMLYSVIEADSHQAAAAAFENHPHLQIPRSHIQIMEVRSMAAA